MSRQGNLTATSAGHKFTTEEEMLQRRQEQIRKFTETSAQKQSPSQMRNAGSGHAARGMRSGDSQMEGGQGHAVSTGMGSQRTGRSNQNAGRTEQNYSMSSEGGDVPRKRKKPAGAPGLDGRHEGDLAQQTGTFEIEECQQQRRKQKRPYQEAGSYDNFNANNESADSQLASERQ